MTPKPHKHSVMLRRMQDWEGLPPTASSPSSSVGQLAPGTDPDAPLPACCQHIPGFTAASGRGPRAPQPCHSSHSIQRAGDSAPICQASSSKTMGFGKGHSAALIWPRPGVVLTSSFLFLAPPLRYHELCRSKAKFTSP